MIEGHNSLQNVFPEHDIIQPPTPRKEGQSMVDYVLGDLKERRDTVLNGGINCIPWPFPRFREEIPGIEQEQYVVITANEKVGKSQVANFVYVFHLYHVVLLVGWQGLRCASPLLNIRRPYGTGS